MDLKNLKKLAKEEETKKAKTKSDAIKIEEESIIQAIDEFCHAKLESKKFEAIMKTQEKQIKEFACEKMIEQISKEKKHDSIRLATDDNSILYIVQDRYSKKVFETEDEKKSFFEDMEDIFGKKAKELIEEKNEFKINEEALQNQKIIDALVKFASKIQEEFGVELLKVKETVEAKKGALEVMEGLKKDKIKKAFAMLGPIASLK